MDQGQWFREASGSRVMVKLHATLGSGFKQFTMRFVVPPDHPAVDPSLGCQDTKGIPCNAIDSAGVHCWCPPWVEFEPIDNPFP